MEDNAEALMLLDGAVQEEATVTVVTFEDRRLTGTPKPHPTDPAAYIMRTGSRGRPPVFYPEDVVEVIFE